VVVQGFEDSSGADDIMDDMDFVPSFPNGANGSRSIEDLNESAASEWTPASPRAGAEGMDESQISIPEGPEDSTFEGSTCSGFDEVDLEEILEGGVKVEDFRVSPHLNH
jgi:propanediol dehydratase small subunit